MSPKIRNISAGLILACAALILSACGGQPAAQTTPTTVSQPPAPTSAASQNVPTATSPNTSAVTGADTTPVVNRASTTTTNQSNTPTRAAPITGQQTSEPVPTAVVRSNPDAPIAIPRSVLQKKGLQYQDLPQDMLRKSMQSQLNAGWHFHIQSLLVNGWYKGQQTGLYKFVEMHFQLSSVDNAKQFFAQGTGSNTEDASNLSNQVQLGDEDMVLVQQGQGVKYYFIAFRHGKNVTLLSLQGDNSLTDQEAIQLGKDSWQRVQKSG